MNATPRTDAVICNDDGGNGYIVNLASITRQLELELAAAKQRADEWERCESELHYAISGDLDSMGRASRLYLKLKGKL